MTMAIRALKAAKIDFELFTYDYTPHGGTAECSRELGIDHHATIKTIILEDETKKPFVCLMHGDKEISLKNLARAHRGICAAMSPAVLEAVLPETQRVSVAM